MHVFLEFSVAMVWAQIVALAFRRLIWREMLFSLTGISGLMGGIAGWLLGAMSADHLAWFTEVSHANRLLVIGVIVVVFVAGFQRLLSKENA